MPQGERGTLEEELAKAPLPLSEVLRRALELAAAIHQVHRQGRAHGRIEPGRIIITPGGIRLAEVAENTAALTPYTAPEQLRGESGDPRSDIFAFGAAVYEMATGWRAFPGTSPEELRAAILEKDPAPLTRLLQGAPAAAYAPLERLVGECLNKNPNQRRQRMQNVVVELKLMGTRAPARESAPAAPPRARAVPLAPIPATLPIPAAPLPDCVAFPTAAALRVPAESLLPAAAPASEGDQPEPVLEPVAEPAASDAAATRTPPDTEIESAPAPVAAIEPTPAAAQDDPFLRHLGFGVEPECPYEEPPKKVVLKLKLERQQVWWGILKILALLAVAAAAATGVLAALGYLRLPFFGQRTAPIGEMRFALPAPEQASYMSSPAISPDGRLLAFSAVGPHRQRRLWIRPLDSLRATPLAGTEDALAPFWSPDSREIGFFAGRQLKKIAASGESAATLCDTDGPAGGGSWNRQGVIIFGRGFSSMLYRVSAQGGTPEPVTRLDTSRGERAHLWPRFLPDGRHFLFYALAEQADNNGVSVGSLGDQETMHLVKAETNAIYAESTASGSAKKGYLLFAAGRHLSAQPFDAVRHQLLGEPFTIAEDISYLESLNLLPISASDNGLVAYQNIDAPKRQLIWFDREGKQSGVLGEPGEFGQARISPDGRYVAANRMAPEKDSADLWLYDLQANTARQFTDTPAHEGAPVWSPDGKQIVFFANPNGKYDLYRKSLGGGEAERLLATGEDKYPNDWSPDGRYLLFGSMGASTNSDLYLLPLKGERKPRVYLQTVSTEGYGSFSPDGKWLAWQSDETGRPEVYVEAFPRAQGQTRRYEISTGGGGLPRWRQDGKELYYITMDGKVMAVAINTAAGFLPSQPRLLFQTHALPRTWNLFDVTRDGRRFLVNMPMEWATSSPIVVVANWTAGFKVR